MRYFNTRAAISTVVLGFCITFSFAENVAGKKIFDRHSNAVITVKFVLKSRVVVKGREMQKSEDANEAVATIVSPDGLAISSLSVVEPARLTRQFLGEEVKVESEVVDVKMLFSDGRELPAKIILRDSDLDLVFIRPAEKQVEPFPFVDLSSNSPAEILDEFLVLSRLGRVANRIAAVSIGHIEAIVKKPRTYYILDEDMLSGKLGAPAFLSDGKIIGLLLTKLVSSGRKASPSFTDMIFGGTSSMGLIPIILPAGDILEVSKQVPVFANK